MPIVCSNDARMESYDFKNKDVYRDTYNALWGLIELAFDPGRLNEHPGRDWDRSQLLKMPLAMDSIPSFLVNFSTFVLPMPALSNPCFDCFGFLMYCMVC